MCSLPRAHPPERPPTPQHAAWPRLDPPQATCTPLGCSDRLSSRISSGRDGMHQPAISPEPHFLVQRECRRFSAVLGRGGTSGKALCRLNLQERFAFSRSRTYEPRSSPSATMAFISRMAIRLPDGEHRGLHGARTRCRWRHLMRSGQPDGRLWYPKWYPGRQAEKDVRRLSGRKWLITIDKVG